MEVGNASVTGQLQELGEKKIATSKEQSTNNTIKTNSIYVRGMWKKLNFFPFPSRFHCQFYRLFQ